MSLIVHRCLNCRHNNMDHTDRECSMGACRCKASEAVWSESEVIPAWRFGTGELVPALIEPGTKARLGGPSLTQVCGCDNCRALYGRLGGVAS